MSSLLKFLVLFFSGLMLLRWLFAKIFGGAVQQRSAPRQASTARTITGQTVKDPQCGMYVASSLAITSRLDGKLYHFCSAECRDRYLAGHRAEA